MTCCAVFGYAQKKITKNIVRPETKFVKIDVSACFRLTLDTHQGNTVKVTANIEGEYAEDLAVSIEEQGKTVFIDTGFLPNFAPYNDKLSAHKIISIALDITLPEFMKVSVFGLGANVSATGNYRNLDITLSDGNCRLSNLMETVNVKTQRGEVVASGIKGAVDAKSKFGEVLMGPIPKGDVILNLFSVEGDIIVNGEHL